MNEHHREGEQHICGFCVEKSQNRMIVKTLRVVQGSIPQNQRYAIQMLSRQNGGVKKRGEHGKF